jgi:hypothetical protein
VCKAETTSESSNRAHVYVEVQIAQDEGSVVEGGQRAELEVAAQRALQRPRDEPALDVQRGQLPKHHPAPMFSAHVDASGQERPVGYKCYAWSLAVSAACLHLTASYGFAFTTGAVGDLHSI